MNNKDNKDNKDHFLVEIFTEELPPKTLFSLAETFAESLRAQFKQFELSFDAVHFFASPRRIAVMVDQLSAYQQACDIERKGPKLTAAFDQAGAPTKACEGFARSLGVSVSELVRIKNPEGEWIGFRQHVPGKSVFILLPDMVEQALIALPMGKRMRWGEGATQFVRPVHSVILLFGNQVVPAAILGQQANRLTRGHRFLAPDEISVPTAQAYAALLETKGFVIADFAKRRERIIAQSNKVVSAVAEGALLVFNDALLDEVTGLVEWPYALLGTFDEAFLKLPREVLVSAMENHQRYFPICSEEGSLLASFIIISNIEAADMQKVKTGNERVLRARLADAAFFFEKDGKETLANRMEHLKKIVYQAKLGSLYDKANRLAAICRAIAGEMHGDEENAARAGMLAKTDLTTGMVNEFPELQGVMGHYYALRDGEAAVVALALREQYMPRFSGDALPESVLGQILALGDRLDMLVGAFGISQFPTGDKDPYGLRRAAIGLLRILIEKQINVDLRELFVMTKQTYQVPLANTELTEQLVQFILERLRVWYQEQQIGADVFASVASLGLTNLFVIDQRVRAIHAFKKLAAAEALSAANKRVINILSKQGGLIEAKAVDPAFFEKLAEKKLAEVLTKKIIVVTELNQAGNYKEALSHLATLQGPVDEFFDQVMVMTDDLPRRENRLLLLKQLRELFLQVADIALLQ